MLIKYFPMYFQSFLRRIGSRFSSNAILPKDYVRLNVPYFSQWESPSLVDDLISGKIKTASDTKWFKSGAKTVEEYDFWSWNICGMACLKMILLYKLRKNIPTIKLAKKCAEYGGYSPRKAKNGDIPGLYYAPFCKFIKNEFGLEGKVFAPLTLVKIKHALSSGSLVIASVHHNIRALDSKTPTTKGGHLVLIVGYKEEPGLFFIHNPSGLHRKSQRNHRVSYKDFKRFFVGRGIIVQ